MRRVFRWPLSSGTVQGSRDRSQDHGVCRSPECDSSTPSGPHTGGLGLKCSDAPKSTRSPRDSPRRGL